MLRLNAIMTAAAFAYTFNLFKDENSYTHDTGVDYAKSLKEQKENFVTGHEGTTTLELMIICAVAPISVFLYLDFSQWLMNAGSWKLNMLNPFRARVVVEYIVVILPMVLSQTFLFIPWGIGILFVQLLFAQILNSRKRRRRTWPWAFNAQSAGYFIPLRLPLLTCYRATVLFMTFVAILAVDFRIFPRRYAKTETKGYGLMDLGTGSFIFSSALVSSFAKRGTYRPSKTVVRRSMPLILLGLVRLVSHKGLDYQEHATEYGIHWNFFFTLALVLNGAHFIRTILKIRFIFVPLTLLIIYQLFLSHGGQNFVENAPRWYTSKNDANLFDNFIQQSWNLLFANREGVLGSIGYLSLYLISEHISSFCLWDCEKIGYPLEARFLSVSCILWTLHWFLTSILHIPVSRRSTNASYIIWVMAHNTLQLFLYSIIFSSECDHDSGDQDRKISQAPNALCPFIFDSINRHGLLVFVIANLLTGLVNLSLNTMDCSVKKAFFIMALYSLTLSILALAFDWIHPRLFDQTLDRQKM